MSLARLVAALESLVVALNPQGLLAEQTYSALRCYSAEFVAFAVVVLAPSSSS